MLRSSHVFMLCHSVTGGVWVVTVGMRFEMRIRRERWILGWRPKYLRSTYLHYPHSPSRAKPVPDSRPRSAGPQTSISSIHSIVHLYKIRTYRLYRESEDPSSTYQLSQTGHLWSGACSSKVGLHCCSTIYVAPRLPARV
ncbi:hypothetical protein K402DRAFT_166634 [Aulographum hederae CBS 113979]|uniref:Uncharacterized protein n=1 Tax=Aulographum hederae CBS 113979 TaxID=1176131 RepID=A0A6G1GRK5_9PEZI|nr:hypothetical protein K402DRAFT_166634 [Aulographum hederae CBS 113979]